MKTGGL